MSDHNPAENPQNTPNTPDSSANWFSGWDEFLQPPDSHDDAAPESVTTPQEVWPGWQTVDFPDAISADAIQPQSVSAEPSLSEPPAEADSAPGSIDLPDWSVRKLAPKVPAAVVNHGMGDGMAELPQVDPLELISLIQELNQCNNALLDRVSQLEDALDHSQKARVAEREGASQDATNLSELVLAKQQVTQLFAELEKSHQTSQRQQELIESLTAQVNTSHAQIAELEQSCAALQQQAAEQGRSLAQSEATCRDLQVRLQRQQRHTLQFKAALERSLEVAPLEAPLASIGDTAQPNAPITPISPKIHHIQPWTTADGESNLPGKLDALLGKATPPGAFPSDLLPPESATSLDRAEDAGPLPEPVAHAVQEAASELKSTLDNLLNESDAAGDRPHQPDRAGEGRIREDVAEQTQRGSERDTAGDRPSPVPTAAVPAWQPPADRNRKIAPLSMPMAEGATPKPLTANPAKVSEPVALSVAPIVYPTRPLQKITSLAAVDLPTFPR
ncbi:MAG: hypothetical protein KME20_07235 [Kaiparowitsia implicata GSE-PSE-MK54-09C]|jgi:hypothetical protein|nr:hypothetical protein [Kaiparowitsia implicata GSE-PSE-MK54-09C]